MTVDELTELFLKHEDAFMDRVIADAKTRREHSYRRDLRAFNLLDKLVPGTGDIVNGAEHDKIWLSPTLEELAQVVTEEDVIALIECGVFLDDEVDSLSMFT